MEAQCRAHWGGQQSEGRARLESGELVFRGEFRAAVRLKEVQSAAARDGRLLLRSPAGTLILELGPAAEKWARKINNPRSLIDKLGVKPEHRVMVEGVDDKEFRKQLRERGARVVKKAGTKEEERADILFLGIGTRDELKQLARAEKTIKRNGAVWLVRPKGTKEINDLDVMAAAKAAGLVDVKVASFSATHTAEKLVVPLNRR
jgi:hypothetical protein